MAENDELRLDYTIESPEERNELVKKMGFEKKEVLICLN